MSTSTHDETEQLQLLQRLADEEMEQARYDEWVREKVAAARADTRPGMTTDQVRELLNRRYEELSSSARARFAKTVMTLI